MRAKFIALLALFMVLGFSEQGFAYKINHYREGENVRTEASRRNVKLIPIALAQMVAARQVGSSNISFSDIELNDEAESYPDGSDFRPVYKMNVISNGKGYNVDVDAATSRVLGFRQEY